LLATVGLALTAAVVWWSGATLGEDAAALARIKLEPLAGSLTSAKAFGTDGRRIPLTISGGRLRPRTLVPAGEGVTVVVVIRRPGWLAWALGQKKSERLRLRTPVAQLRQRWVTAASDAPVRLRFAEPVAKLAFGTGGRWQTEAGGGQRDVSLTKRTASGTVMVRSAARQWENLGPAVQVTWFPRSPLPALIASPPAKRPISPRTVLRLTFSRPLSATLGSSRPHFASPVNGRWLVADSHTPVFKPTGFGFPFASHLELQLPLKVSLSNGNAIIAAQALEWKIADASFLRLQQLLASSGYLPLDWRPAHTSPPRRLSAQLNAAVTPPAGRFVWRYPNTPPELQRLWIEGQPNEITRGAVMMFEDDHHLPVDGLVGPRVWHALIEDNISGKRRNDGYSYVFVHRNVPQLLTLWHNGNTVLTSPGNTGVPAAPTQLGTFPVFEHIPIGTMSGTNPDGSHYTDPGIRWISYFHGGDALHAFTRASFGTPQSLGCVELPLATAAKVWPYTPIGTLVTIEN
jgi:peptidoglycan hydrolase-like protein with peptidoglycan-binding domain